MSAPNTTPGPWVVPDRWDVRGETITATDGDICTLPEWPINLLPEAKANAHLIAAAPDMYEALKSLYEYACRISGDPEPEIPRLRQARLALAKARGEVQP